MQKLSKEENVNSLNCQELYRKLVKIHEEIIYCEVITDEEIEAYNREQTIKEFTEIFKKLYFKSRDEDFSWEYCPSSVYEKNYEVKKQEYIKKFIDAYEIDFIISELRKIRSHEFYKIKKPGDKPYKDIMEDPYLYPEIDAYYTFGFNDEIVPFNNAMRFNGYEMPRSIELTQKRKIDFLEEKQQNLEAKVTLTDEPIEKEIPEYEIEFIKEKITILHELGVIDQIKKIPPFNYPCGLTNLLAPLLDEGKTTIQPILGRLMNGTGKESENPLTDKYLKKTHTKLINMGVDPKHFKTTIKNK